MITNENVFLHAQRSVSDQCESVRAPFMQSGRLIEMDAAYIKMQAGRTIMRFHVNDFYGILGGPLHALRILQDAVRHHDFVKIRVTNTRLSYHNQAQYNRLLKEKNHA